MTCHGGCCRRYGIDRSRWRRRAPSGSGAAPGFVAGQPRRRRRSRTRRAPRRCGSRTGRVLLRGRSQSSPGLPQGWPTSRRRCSVPTLRTSSATDGSRARTRCSPRCCWPTVPCSCTTSNGWRRRQASVVLSACHAGSHATPAGREILGLTASLLARGPRSVVASTVPIPDALSTVGLMTELHTSLAAGAGAAAALVELRRTRPRRRRGVRLLRSRLNVPSLTELPGVRRQLLRDSVPSKHRSSASTG